MSCDAPVQEKGSFTCDLPFRVKGPAAQAGQSVDVASAEDSVRMPGAVSFGCDLPFRGKGPAQAGQSVRAEDAVTMLGALSFRCDLPIRQRGPAPAGESVDVASAEKEMERQIKVGTEVK